MSNLRTPDFPRPLKAGIEETELVLAWFSEIPDRTRTMLDVGAHRGTSTRPFAEQGWRVHAFEPDPKNRALFERDLTKYSNVTVDPRAVSNVDGHHVTLYTSEESSGITSLVAFTDGHAPTVTVETIRLDTFISEESISKIDFLKMDTEGFDLMVLEGFPWSEMRPPVVLCEFEDNKTKIIGYSTGDMIDFLVDRGYTLLISEWHPIERYGIVHSFRQIRNHDGSTPRTVSWGNIIAVSDPTAAKVMMGIVPNYINRRNDFRDAAWSSARFDYWKMRNKPSARTPTPF